MAKKKRTITPEHLAKMQEGKKKAKLHRERMEQLSDLDGRLQNAERETSKPLKVRIRRRKKKF